MTRRRLGAGSTVGPPPNAEPARGLFTADPDLFGLYRMHPDGTHRQAILPLSPFRPSLIDWGARPSGHD